MINKSILEKLDVLREQVLEENKWKEVIRAGNMSLSGIQKLKDAGIPKTAEQYSTGIKKGADNVFKRYGAIVVDRRSVRKQPGPIRKVVKNTKKSTSMIDGESAPSLKKLLVSTGHDPQKADNMIRLARQGYFGASQLKGQNLYGSASSIAHVPRRDVIGRAHEAGEIRHGSKLTGIVDNLPEEKRHAGAVSLSMVPMYTGGHMSPSILKAERKNVELHRRLYPDSKLGREAQRFSDAREFSGEYDHLTTIRKNHRKITKKMKKGANPF